MTKAIQKSEGSPPQRGGGNGGLDEFWSVLADLRKFWALIVAGAALPLLANLVEITPPWPSGISTLTSIALIIATVLSYQGLRTKRLPGRRVFRLLQWYGLALSVLLPAYLMSISLLVYKPPNSDLVFVKGFVCTQFVTKSDQCPFLSDNALKEGGWDPEVHWTPLSIAAARVSLVVIWLAMFFSLSSLISSFITFWRIRAAR